jgi:hypothetical protein
MGVGSTLCRSSRRSDSLGSLPRMPFARLGHVVGERAVFDVPGGSSPQVGPDRPEQIVQAAAPGRLAVKPDGAPPVRP